MSYHFYIHCEFLLLVLNIVEKWFFQTQLLHSLFEVFWIHTNHPQLDIIVMTSFCYLEEYCKSQLSAQVHIILKVSPVNMGSKEFWSLYIDS